MKQMNSDAVSPVVGVMLMLVVTIIIAAVVSAFAGGLGGSQQKTPQATITANPVIQAIANKALSESYPTGFTAANGILFENTGGDTFSLDGINIQLEGGGTKYTITWSDSFDTTATCLPDGIKSGKYFQKVGSSKSDKTIAPGDKFMFYADGNYVYNGVKMLVWHPKGPKDGIGIPFGQKTGYMIIDKDSNKPMASGYVVFR